MTEAIYAAGWFCLLVVPPGLAQHGLIRRLEAERTDSPRRRMRLRAWNRADANPLNYTARGEKLLVVFTLLRAAQALAFVGWAIAFVL